MVNYLRLLTTLDEGPDVAFDEIYAYIINIHNIH